MLKKWLHILSAGIKSRRSVFIVLLFLGVGQSFSIEENTPIPTFWERTTQNDTKSELVFLSTELNCSRVTITPHTLDFAQGQYFPWSAKEGVTQNFASLHDWVAFVNPKTSEIIPAPAIYVHWMTSEKINAQYR